MNQATIRQLHRLCSRAEALQIKLAAAKSKSDNDRRCYESVKAAKDELLDALRLAEEGK